MKDETYTFFEDVREKSKTARSAHARPQRGKSRFKQYTAKEVREMSGPDYSVKLGKRMTFQERKALPESLQQGVYQGHSGTVQGRRDGDRRRAGRAPAGLLETPEGPRIYFPARR